MAESPLADPSPAATLVLFRPPALRAEPARPELLFVERGAAMAFAAGALAFPGGRIDRADVTLAERALPHDPHGAAKIAAIRETIEETGIAVGLAPLPQADAVAAMRLALSRGAPLAALLDAGRHRIAPRALEPFARWCPDHPGMRRYDTLFFIATCPPAAPEPHADGSENRRAFWAGAGDVLAQCARGEAAAIFPTRRNLERLARFASVDDALADARTHGTPMITPWIEQRDGIALLCIPEDAGYPITTEPLAHARRS